MKMVVFKDKWNKVQELVNEYAVNNKLRLHETKVFVAIDGDELVVVIFHR